MMKFLLMALTYLTQSRLIYVVPANIQCGNNNAGEQQNRETFLMLIIFGFALLPLRLTK